jgi:hypothetical protein
VELERKKEEKRRDVFSRWNERETQRSPHKISWQASKRGLKKLHERVNNDERRNARAREKSLLERREKQS